jgi:hypothetical protein
LLRRVFDRCGDSKFAQKVENMAAASTELAEASRSRRD